ncbi:hypothetical protein F5882DRAFT_423247 [Hyaloscypha sp. PMI_1271]|nr:hypothetical protein F5882DRAFT_423247 [Hyaloscypha sp. PMI_1271]
MKFSSILVRGLQNVMNAEIEIPLLSTLYRKISGNHNLTMVDAICLLVAIPSTVLYKAVTKKRPRDDPIIKDFLGSCLKTETITRIAAAIASHGNGITPPALYALPFATLFSAGSVAAQVGIVALCYESGTYHEVGSLFGI